jgi:uncharacterized protein (TIGR03067 family)
MEVAMSRLTLLITTAALLIGVEPSQDDAEKKELERLQGTWSTLSIEVDGQKATDEERIKTRKLIVAGNRYTLKVEGETVQGTIEVNPTQKPKTIDEKPDSGLHKGRTLLGIYELEGDNLKICLALPGRGRPTEFASKAGTKHQLVIYKREKSESPR